MDNSLYTWEPYTVETEDGWTLSMFRVTGKNDDTGKKITEVDEGKFPVIVWHGGTQDALKWALDSSGIIGGQSQHIMPLQLVDNGYDVFMINARGTRYSNTNTKDGEWTDAERWNFSAFEFAKYDQLVFIDKVLEVSGKDKVTWLGYSLGTSTMFYGLGINTPYLESKVNRFVALAPCIYEDTRPTYEGLVGFYKKLHDIGVHYLAGPDWKTNGLKKICDAFGADSQLCKQFGSIPDDAQAVTNMVSVSQS